jgi:hypothetical protein
MTYDFNISKWLESEAYEKQKAVVNRDINALRERVGYALPRLAAPAQLYIIDYSVFRKSDAERMQVYSMKKLLPKTRTHKFKRVLHESF